MGRKKTTERDKQKESSKRDEALDAFLAKMEAENDALKKLFDHLRGDDLEKKGDGFIDVDDK